jgi:hypothetical protein
LQWNFFFNFFNCKIVQNCDFSKCTLSSLRSLAIGVPVAWKRPKDTPPTILGNHLNSIWMWEVLPCAWSPNHSWWSQFCDLGSWWLLGTYQLRLGSDSWSHIWYFLVILLVEFWGRQRYPPSKGKEYYGPPKL